MQQDNYFTRANCDNNEGWLTQRGFGIGGSDAACIVNKNPYKTDLELWQEKMGLIQPEDISNKKAVWYGKNAEEHIRALFALEHKEDLIVTYNPYQILIDNDFQFLRASLDGELEEIGTGRKGILEIKTTNLMQSFRLEDWKDKVPDNYYCQILHYLSITRYDFVILVAEIRRETQEGVIFTRKQYYFDRKDIEKDIQELRKAEINWWVRHVEHKQQPTLKIRL